MHHRAVTLEQLADLLEDATITGAIRTAPVWANVGEHPRYGFFSTLEEGDPEWIIVRSERPLDMPLPTHTTPAAGFLGLVA